MQANGDFVIAVHAVHAVPHASTETIRFEKITESNVGKTARTSGGFIKAYDPSDKEEIFATIGRYGMEVRHCGVFCVQCVNEALPSKRIPFSTRVHSSGSYLLGFANFMHCRCHCHRG